MFRKRIYSNACCRCLRPVRGEFDLNDVMRFVDGNLEVWCRKHAPNDAVQTIASWAIQRYFEDVVSGLLSNPPLSTLPTELSHQTQRSIYSSREPIILPRVRNTYSSSYPGSRSRLLGNAIKFPTTSSGPNKEAL
jgi:hypothetical protein